MIERIKTVFKLVMNQLSVNMKTLLGDLSGQVWGVPHLDNLHNAEMNNVVAIDFVVRDWIDDTDYLLGRNTAEFPRMSSTFTDKTKAKPWGNK